MHTQGQVKTEYGQDGVVREVDTASRNGQIENECRYSQVPDSDPGRQTSHSQTYVCLVDFSQAAQTGIVGCVNFLLIGYFLLSGVVYL